MSWYEKGQSAPFENQPIEGMFFLDGDILARKFQRDWTNGQKYPTIIFPSGLQCDLWESTNPANAVVHIFGEMDLHLNDTRDEALPHAEYIAELCGYSVQARGEQGIELIGSDDDDHVLITYDPDKKRVANIEAIKSAHHERPARELLDQKSREALPALGNWEKLGLDTIVPVKFFTPDDQWTWYAAEFDGDNIFFGLVNGFELEFGNFFLSELADVHGPLGLPIERDRFFEPKTLGELLTMHEEERHRRT